MKEFSNDELRKNVIAASCVLGTITLATWLVMLVFT